MSGLLEVAGVSKRFGGVSALNDVSLEVAEAEAVGLIGPNGAGKTTLFDCVSGVTVPDRGDVFFGGRRLGRAPIYKRARLGMGRTFQRLELFAGLTVREHLEVSERERRADGRLWKDLLGRGGIRLEESERVDETLKELGLESVAGSPIEALSLGQGRLVELGRALIREPSLLLLDEPSSGLDSRETAALASVLNELRARRPISVLLVEHDLELVHAVAERVVVLDFGRVVSSGPLAAVLQEPAVQEAYLGATL